MLRLSNPDNTEDTRARESFGEISMKSMILPAMAFLALLAASAFAQPAGPPKDDPNIVYHNALLDLPAKGGAELTVTTPAWVAGGDIPFENSDYRGNHFPGLEWTAGPSGTKSYAVILQDSGVVGGVRHRPLTLHWTLYDVPANVMKLPVDMPVTGFPPGASYGPSAQGKSMPFMGPGPPPGPRHVYHMQVFALDTLIPINADMTFDGLTGAMKGHVLASGEIVGLGAVDPDNWPRKPRPPTASVPASAAH
jgi:para-nitrobenzyl esterase